MVIQIGDIVRISRKPKPHGCSWAKGLKAEVINPGYESGIDVRGLPRGVVSINPPIIRQGYWLLKTERRGGDSNLICLTLHERHFSPV